MSDVSAPWSLQTRVELISSVALCTGLVVGSVSMFKAAAVEDDQVVDQRVEILAERILRTIEEEPLLYSVHQHAYPQEAGKVSASAHAGTDIEEQGLHMYQVWLHDGTQLLRAHNTKESKPFLPIPFSGYQEIELNGEKYCVYSAANWNREIVVQVAERTPERMVQIGLLLGQYLLYVLLPFFAIFYVTRRLLKRAFQPLDNMAHDLLRRGPRDLDAMVLSNPPLEILPVVRSLNSHFVRIGHAMTVEQRFTSVAAHELRTPLAGIRAQAQIASRASDAEDLRESLSAVMHGVDKASRVIDQLIDLHRVETAGDDIELSRERVDFDDLHHRVMDELGGMARAKKITVSAVFEVGHIQGIDFAIYMLMRNLVANAIGYSPEGARVDVHTSLRDDHVVLVVDDSGPGIAATDRDGAFAKFNRLGRAGTDGVGLGLSIVAQVAQLHGARVEMLTAPLGGLRARVRFPRAR